MLCRWFKAFRRDDEGQSLIEYTLLVAFLALASAGVLMQVGSNSAGAWSGAQTTLDGAATSASGTSPTTTAPDPPPSGGGDGRDHHHDGHH